MASKAPEKCCTAGVKHSGEPTGKTIKIAGKYEAYIATPPPGTTAHEGAGILYCPDIIGIWANSKLMADQFAASGYLCMIIDYFNGDAWPLNPKGDIDIMTWIRQGSDGKSPHTVEVVDPIVEMAIRTLREEYGITKLGSVGYCFGAKYVVRHYKNGIDVGYVAHPSFVAEEELAAITGPLSIAAAETDAIFPAEMRHRSEEILKETGQPYQINLYSGVNHGFSVRSDPTVKAHRFATKQAFTQAVTWFDNFLL